MCLYINIRKMIKIIPQKLKYHKEIEEIMDILSLSSPYV